MLSEDEKAIIEVRKLRDVNKRNSLGKSIDTVLNLNDRLQKETEEKDKQIDLMAEYISKYHCFEIIVYDLDDECKHEHECKDCIKQYFEKLAKEKGETRCI